MHYLNSLLLQSNQSKLDSHLLKSCFICFNESILKMMKNAYFILKSLFVRKIFNFYLDFLTICEQRLD